MQQFRTCELEELEELNMVVQVLGHYQPKRIT